MARYRDGLKVATCIFEAAAWHYSVRVECRCRREGLFEAHGLWWKFQRKGWSDDSTARPARSGMGARCDRWSWRRATNPRAITFRYQTNANGRKR